MKKCLLVIVIISITNFIAFAQQKTSEKTAQNNEENFLTREESRQYKIQYNFIEKTFLIYKMTYNTTVKRTYADSTVQNFERNIETYLSFWRPSEVKDGFAELRTSLDSVVYKYSDSAKQIKWSSTSDEDELPENADFDMVFAILGRSFWTTISPYFEVAKIEDETLNEVRKNIENMSDTNLKRIWKKANTDENLNFYSDMNKNVLRNGRFALDSAWKMRFSIPIEGIRYACDTATVEFYLYDGKNYNIKAEMLEMYPNLTDSASVIGMNRDILPVDSTSFSSGFWDVSVSPRGMLDKVDGTFLTKTNSSKNGLKFSDEIHTVIKYEFVRLERWRD